MKRNHEKCLDSQLWNACAGGMVQMPPVNSKVFYFPQGHAEHATGNVDFGNSQVPSLILCRMSSIKYMADGETDEVFAKIRLIPVKSHELELDDEMPLVGEMENVEKAASFAKTLTQSDANNGGGFSVPRYCAETIFPRLDYSAEPPVQTIIAKDVHGESWKFRHIYRGTPRRHLLTTGWSNFVNKKKLVAGDSIVFLRADNGDLCVGIRRAKRGIGGGPEYGSGWNTGGSGTCVPPFGGYYGNGLLQKGLNGDVQGKVTGESVVRAATLAATGQPFEVVYYPRASTPEFFVKAASVSAAMRIQWCSGMRFKMPFETEDSSRISWFMGTISSVQVADPIRWPNSPWRLLQVAWDEPDLLQNVKRVSPWLVELVSSMPSIHLSPFSPPRKKLRVPVPPNADFSLMDQIALPSSFPGNHPLMVAQNSPLCFIPDNIPAGIQGARHAHHHYGLSPPDLRLNKLHSGLFPVGSQQLDYNPRFLSSKFLNNNESDPKGNNISCRLTMGTPVPAHCLKENGEKKSSPPHILLFGQLILAENQSSESSLSDGNNTDKTSNSSGGSGSALHQNGPPESSSEDGLFPMFKVHQKGDLESETGHCKVFMESEDVGRTLDLSVFGSYEELYRNIAEMFGMEGSEVLSNILYRDAAGAIKHAGDEPFCDFLKTAKRLTIPTGSSMMK